MRLLQVLIFFLLNAYARCLEQEGCGSDVCDANVALLQHDLQHYHENTYHAERSEATDHVFKFLRSIGRTMNLLVNNSSHGNAVDKSEKLEPPSDSVRPLPFIYTTAYRLLHGREKTIVENLLSPKGLCVCSVLVIVFVSIFFTGYSAMVKQLVVLALGFGMLNVLIKDGLTHVEVPPGENRYPCQFNQPSLFNLVTMLGMSCCLPIWLVAQCIHRQTSSEDAVEPRPSVPFSVYFNTMVMHWLALFIVNVSYQHLLGSTIQMMRGSKLLFTCILSFLFLNRKMKLNQVLGVGCAVIGVLLTAQGKTSVGSKAESAAKWVCIVCISEFIRSVMFVYQEKVMKQYKIPALQLTGYIGAIGVPFSLMGTVVANWMGIEDFSDAVYQVEHSPSLCRILMCFVGTVLAFELFSITLTKNADAVLRALMELLRIPLVWLVEIVLNWDTFALWQATGLVMLFIGFFLEQSTALDWKAEDIPEDKATPGSKKAAT